MAGVETSYEPGASTGWANVYVGLVERLEPHPNADRLRLATVDLGSEYFTVVCGAPNIEVGQHIAFAKVGARLLDGKTGEPMELTAATIRGTLSEGMVCSERELGLSDAHEGILVLPGDSPLGLPLAALMPDDVLEIEVTANRGDCLSILGVAHEVAAITGESVIEPSLDYDESTESVEDTVTVRIDDPELCYRYTATVTRGVKIGPSPDWLKRRLEQAGQRSINNVVDVTNYVMLEYGQPLHAFDLGVVSDKTIIVRSARAGERFATLDGVEHELRPPMLLITDPQKAIGVAGVMGGLNSEMTEATSDVLLESATFNAINTRRTAFALQTRTEASLRFEKGLNPELASRAVRRATALILETAGGTACRGVSDTFPGATEPTKILFTGGHMQRVLGVAFPQTQVITVLRALGFEVSPIDEERMLVVPPYWRTDVSIEEDVIEEVARTVGYDLVPEVPLGGKVPPSMVNPMRGLREEIRDLLAGAGMQETIAHSLVSRASLEEVLAAGDGRPEPLSVVNPMSREQELLRTSLRGAVLRAAATGLHQPGGSVAFFEVGRVYLPRDGELPDERETAVGVVGGSRGRSMWDREEPARDFYEAKGVLLAMMERLGLTPTFERGTDELLHPGRTARVLANGRDVGVVGELHPRVIASFDLASEHVALFEIDIESLLKERHWLRYRFEPFSRFPSAVRDLALLVDKSVPASEPQRIIDEHPLVVQTTLFDVFEEGLTTGKKSLALRVELQSASSTLSPEQLTKAMAEIVAELERKIGATLRA